MQLKDEMGVENIKKREDEILQKLWMELEPLSNVHILANEHKNRLGIISFYIDELHYNVGVKLLNDKFGIQTRGGCSCAGTYGHYLLNVTPTLSNSITNEITNGNCSNKPGWIRLSIHPTHTDKEISYITNAIKELSIHHKKWSEDYDINLTKGEIKPIDMVSSNERKNSIDDLFIKSLH